MFTEISTKKVLILGCGNVLMGDDGFGPAVIKKLQQRYNLPDYAYAEDVGTSIRGVLFDITLLDKRPEHIIVLDAVDKPGHVPGDVFEIDIDDIPEQKIVDYSVHQFPTTNMLKGIQDECGVKVTIIAGQVANQLKEVKPGLSDPMRSAVVKAAEKVAELV